MRVVVNMWVCVLCCIFHVLKTCNGVIYHLNDTEYERMPPLFNLDHYDSCLTDVDGVYCVVRLDLHAEPTNELMNIIKEYSAHTSKHYNHGYIERGVCVTKTCKGYAENKNLDKSEDLHAVLEPCLNESIWNEYKIQANLSNVYYCDKHNEETRFDISDWIVAGVFAVLTTLVLLGTFYDAFYCNTESQRNSTEVTERAKRSLDGNKFLLNFSLRKNWRDLVNPEVTDPRYERLLGLHGLRSITTCLMVIAHVAFVVSMGFTDRTHDFEKTYDWFHYQVVYNGLVIVQIFFLMAAFLQSYTIQLRCETTEIGWSHLPKLLIARWWRVTGTVCFTEMFWVTQHLLWAVVALIIRLTPANAAMVAFSATWLRHLGSGPLWKLYVTNSVAADCRRYWWLHLLYLNNYEPDDKMCALQTWHVAADTQLFVITMLMYFATMSGGRRMALALLLLVSIIAPALHVWLHDLDALVLMTPEFYRSWINDTFHKSHILGHNNLASYVIGFGTGTLVYNWQKRNVEFSKYKKWGVLSWCIILAIGCLFLSGRMFFVDGPRAPLAIRMLYAGAYRVTMCVLVAMIVVALTMRLNTSFSNFFEWRGFLVPSRLSYSVYLVHMNFVHVLLGIRTQLSPVSLFYMLVIYFGVVVMSVMLALPFHLTIEAPMSGLLKMALSLKDTTQRKLQSKSVSNGKKIA